MSITSKSVSVPTTTTGFFYVCAKVSAVDMSVRARWWSPAPRGTLPTAATYKQVCDAYVTYTVQHYRVKSDVVFNGCGRSVSTKAAAQQRSATQSIYADILFECDMKPTTTQKTVLAKSKKKARQIDKLTTELRRAGVLVKQDPADDDRLIVLTTPT